MNTSHCVHCGLCLTTCPTYQETGLESESPRGRIFLLERIKEDLSLLDETTFKYLDDCLDCRACEEVCPAHVPTGHLVDEFRATKEASPYRTNTASVDKPLSIFMGTEKGLEWFQRMARWSSKPSVSRVMELVPSFVPKHALTLKKGLPRKIPRRLSRQELRGGRKTGQVMMFLGCIMDSIYADTNLHTVDLIDWSGSRVVVPENQGCCGALSAHAGDPTAAKAMAKKNIVAFEESQAETLVVNSAGCGAFLKEYGRLFEGDAAWEDRAQKFEQKVQDISEYLEAHPLPEMEPHNTPVSMHDACHLSHAQGIRGGPRELLTRAGYRLVEMPEADRCCGSAGIYNITHPDMAGRLKARKLDDIPKEVPFLAMGNPGCMLHIQSGIQERGMPVEVQHTVDLLWRVYRRVEAYDGR